MPYQLPDAGMDVRERLFFPEAIRGIGLLAKQ